MSIKRRDLNYLWSTVLESLSQNHVNLLGHQPNAFMQCWLTYWIRLSLNDLLDLFCLRYIITLIKPIFAWSFLRQHLCQSCNGKMCNGTFKVFYWRQCDVVFRQTKNQGLGRLFLISGIGVLYVSWQSLLLRLMVLWKPGVFFHEPSSISVTVTTSMILLSQQRNPKDGLNMNVTT